ncbi:MAG: hypothetical protein LBK01_01980 [Burkholderiaceae bacterium]|jgi:hypothetical protein|nr:hypothetical protein [Burkholderiaceae bacterium]
MNKQAITADNAHEIEEAEKQRGFCAERLQAILAGISLELDASVEDTHRNTPTASPANCNSGR